jgi:5-methyltetrahydrofolate--homocysteine methyltransferase
VVHVHDASRAVGVVSDLLDDGRRKVLDRDNRGDQDRVRELYSGRSQKPLLSLEAARANAPRIEWRAEDLPQPAFLGTREVEGLTIRDLEPYIDWTFFFSAWELKMKFPKILDDPKLGPAARELYDNARAMLTKLDRERALGLRGVYGFWPAASEGDDILLLDEARREVRLRLPMLRQQAPVADGKPNRSLADFVAPRGTGLEDHLGAFAVTAGLGADELAAGHERDLDDYSSILVKALADRLAEAFAEYLHERVRREWGHGEAQPMDREALIRESYRGIRPAFGYPACPDHGPKQHVFELLGAEALGMRLTESLAIWPAASVSGMYFAHPTARYFSIGRLGRDQVVDYARRRGMELADMERWLGPSLAYEPS